VAFGIALEFFGGAQSTMGWRAAFVMLAFGSVVAAWAVWAARDLRQDS
jgi:membrane protein implicated in regulation of membrane protease activity